MSPSVEKYQMMGKRGDSFGITDSRQYEKGSTALSMVEFREDRID